MEFASQHSDTSLKILGCLVCLNTSGGGKLTALQWGPF